MPRELWKGAVRFGLVHIPVSLYPAEQREELSFTMLDRRDMSPVGYKRINKNTGDEVPYDQIVKGYEWEDGQYVLVEKEDFKSANVEATQTVDIIGFVDADQIPNFFYESPYYLAPGKHGDKGYALLRETLMRSHKVAIANVVIRTRQHLAVVYPVDNLLVLNTMRYATELRSPEDLDVPKDLETAKVQPRELDMAERLVDDMTMKKWDPTEYHDTYRDDLLKLIEQKARGKLKAAPKAKATRQAEVIDFASLLEKSLAARKGGRPEAANDEDAKPARRRAAPGRAPAAKARRKAASPRATSHQRRAA
jgi:DNA end-binding protein Ku